MTKYSLDCNLVFNLLETLNLLRFRLTSGGMPNIPSYGVFLLIKLTKVGFPTALF